MEPPSGPPRRKCTPWQGPLLTVSLLIFWSRPVTAQLTIESKPVDAAEGSDVLLLVHNQPENPQAYHWFKGEREDSNQKILSLITNTQQITQGPAHSGRETIYPNGSLLIQKVTQNDSGIFHLRITDANFDGHSTSGQIRVYPVLPTPFIRSNTSDLVEGQGSVALTCEPETQNTTYQWSMNNQSLPDSSRLQLSLDNRILTIHNVTRKDTGPYECWTRNPVSVRRSDPFTLNVFYGPDTPTISPPGSSYPPGAKLSLFCLAASNPPAQYSWLIKGRPQQYTQELFILNLSVNDSGPYTCHVHNNVTGLNRTTVRNITVSADSAQGSSPGLSAGAIAGIVIGALAGVVLITAVVYFLYRRKSGGASVQSDLTEHKSSTTNHSQGHSDISSNTTDEVAYSSVNFNAQQLKKPTSVSASPTDTETVYSEVKK
ncbi:cell adhesion molecule CEACAM6-like isoform X1 [Dasypus novemcinctus]|uniref:cell adhesion molecule CEACAM6-like isoform X1 n=1 Tax=Dasypus novemcinctus TaxID=9361 RepID=UPI0003CC0EEE|nr:carcinoembryonic antigen-related cell adhesion molecule 6-like isoform X1 [Dasypus novemcinctus]